ncbi:ribosome production factor 2 homolog [Hydractinia symbiolongicarpus]|uniref:ribosome production factor 2 homolog n=1 Tax=Hydractinia symbiolongicarpus TaxID=13093 RepID=UPI00254BD948|nr:ribosome production factor 2 homolog [Hydractinia symbiolongicarpus]XP_057308394.1 ribosome production factor 2 homolog [Hydractinia symbiolongicarpus]
MASQVSKPKTQRGKRFLLNRDAKLEENTKTVMLIRGGKTSEMVTQAMRDIHALKKPNATMFHRKNILRPFEDQSSLEFFSQRSDASLMVFGSHSKKRPHNLVFGCFYDFHMLDMFELGIERYQPISEFKAHKVTVGTKPCLLFSGEEFENKIEYRRLKSLFIDFWRGEKVENIRLQGLEHILQFTACEDKIYLRSYRVLLKKSGLKTPRVEVEEIGPSFNFALRRTRLATESLYKQSLRQPKALKPRKVKNVEHDVFGTKTGRIHMQKQDLETLQTRKMKGLKRGKKSEEGDNQKKQKTDQDAE